MKSLLVSAAIAALLSGCAAFSPGLDKADQPDPGEAYVYGRFSISAPKATLSIAGHQTMGFFLDCGPNQNILIKFIVEPAIQVIKLPASRSCAFKEVVYTNADGVIKSKKPAPVPLTKTIDYPAGKAYYLGDFMAAARTTVSGGMVYMSWDLRSAEDAYDASTHELRSAYAAFEAFPTERRMLGQ